MLKLSDEEILSSISEHTGMMRAPLWLRHVRYNEKKYGFVKPRLVGTLKDEKALVLGAGPGMKRFGLSDLRTVLAEKPKVIACDGALPTLSQLNCSPDFVVSVDAHPVVANFYRRSRNILNPNVTAMLSTTIHRDVVDICLEAGVKVHWVQGSFKDDTDQFRKMLYRPGAISLNTGGNVGTTCYVLSLLMGCSPVGLMGLEFAWSDETPLVDTQYFAEIMKIVGQDEKQASRLFEHVMNPLDGKFYVADPVYYAYFLRFKELWETLPWETRKKTFNLTMQGLLPKIDGLKYVNAQEFAKI